MTKGSIFDNIGRGMGSYSDKAYKNNWMLYAVIILIIIIFIVLMKG